MNTLIRRELWEHRSIILVPVIVAGLMLLVELYGIVTASQHVHLIRGEINIEMDEMHAHGLTRGAALTYLTMGSLAAPFLISMFIVTFLYLLDCLYAERKDRSVLFWKSLPVSDVSVVGSKLLTAAGVIPLITFAVFIPTFIVLTLLAGLGFSMIGADGANLIWQPRAFISGAVTLLYGLAVQSLWYLPIYGWLLLVSAWARRAVLLWATLPPLALILVEDRIFGTNGFARLLGDRVVGVFHEAFTSPDGMHIELGSKAFNATSLAMPTSFLTSVGLWGGLVVAAAFIAGAVWLRRYRDAE